MKVKNKYFIFDQPQELSLKKIAKKVLYQFLAMLYKGYMKCNKQKNVQEKKYKVSICAIFKNEAQYLKEWIEFNHIVGIEHFYMYNNNSEDEYQQVLGPYIDIGLVTLLDWPYNQQQMEAYKDCIHKFSSETQWIGFIDIDEFIVPKSTDCIYDFLKPFDKKRGSVNIYWKLFGSSGYLKRKNDGYVTEDFTVCWPQYCDIGKCFYNTSFGFNGASKHNDFLHHKFWANINGKDIPPVNIFDHVCVGDLNKADSLDFPIQINHYFTKSYQEYAEKRAKGDVYFKNNPHDMEYFYEHEMKCTSVDYSAYKYLIRLKITMGLDNNEIKN